MTAPTIPGEYQAVAARFAHPFDVRLLLPSRLHLGYSSRYVDGRTGIRRELIRSYEKMFIMMPVEHYQTLESFYLNEYLDKKYITLSVYNAIKSQKTHRLHALSLQLRLKMSTTELMRWKRAIVQLLNREIAECVGYSPHMIDKAMSEGIGIEATRVIMKFLTKLERQTMEAMTYDIYE